MSSLCNKEDTTNTIDNPYHPIYQCPLTKYIEYFKRHTKKYSTISNTNISIKNWLCACIVENRGLCVQYALKPLEENGI